MSVAKRLMDPTVLTTGLVTYYTSPANTRTHIKKWWHFNYTGTNRTITAHVIISGGSAGDANQVAELEPVPLQRGIDLTAGQNIVLEPGDFIQVLCDAATSVNMHLHGVQVPV